MADWRRGHLDVIPGIEVFSTCGAPTSRRLLSADRLDANLWHLLVHADGVCEAELRVLVDSCGAWVTLSTRADRPVVVRRAGWVELRGQRSPDPLERWDRVGLGPGDALVVGVGGSGDGSELLEDLLPLHLGGVEELSLATRTREHVVLRVPPFDPADGARRASLATGLAEDAFATPLFSPGTPTAELWKRRPAPPMEARMFLPPVPESAGRARALLRRLMGSWRMEDLLDDAMELLANELLTNAIVHAGTPIVTVIRYDGTSVRFEVIDGADGQPVAQPPTEDEEGGRGMWIVDQLADRWGLERSGQQKSTWFEVDVDGVIAHDTSVIAAHGVLRVARDLDAAARSLVGASIDGDPPRAALGTIIDRAHLAAQLLIDLVQARPSGRSSSP